MLALLPRCLTAACTLLVMAVTACGDDAPTPVDHLAEARQAQAADAADRAGLSREASSFLVLAAGVVAESFSVTYDLEDGTRAVLIQLPPHRRVDLLAGSVDDAVIRSVIVNRDGTFSCLQEDDEWRCEETKDVDDAGLGPFSASAVQDAVTRLAASKDSYELRVERRRLVGEEATCLTATPKDGDGRAGVLCISAEGVPLLVEGTGAALKAVRYSRDAPASALRLPAEPG